MNLQRERRKQSLPDAAYKVLVTTFSSSCPNKRAHSHKDPAVSISTVSAEVSESPYPFFYALILLYSSFSVPDSSILEASTCLLTNRGSDQIIKFIEKKLSS